MRACGAEAGQAGFEKHWVPGHRVPQTRERTAVSIKTRL